LPAGSEDAGQHDKAALLLDGRATGIDARPLAITRFGEGALLREPLTAHAGTIGG
jgi:hypothetical protein